MSEWTEFEVCLMQDITSAYDRDIPLEKMNLPGLGDPGPPEVRMFREQVLKFRAHYSELLWFAGRMLDVDPKKVTRLHLIADLLPRGGNDE